MDDGVILIAGLVLLQQETSYQPCGALPKRRAKESVAEHIPAMVDEYMSNCLSMKSSHGVSDGNVHQCLPKQVSEKSGALAPQQSAAKSPMQSPEESCYDSLTRLAVPLRHSGRPVVMGLSAMLHSPTEEVTHARVNRAHGF